MQIGKFRCTQLLELCINLVKWCVPEQNKLHSGIHCGIMSNYYAVARGRCVGIYRSWDECKSQVEKFPNARYKKFPDQQSAASFIQQHSDSGTVGVALETKALLPAISGIKSKSSRSISGGSKQLLSSTNVRSQVPAQSSTLFVPSREISTTAISFKRKLKVTEDIIVPIKKLKVDRTKGIGEIKFNVGVDIKNFTVDEDGYIVVYTDGACKGNGKKRARAGIGVWFGDSHTMNISQPVEGDHRTNNTAEIQAAEFAIRKAKEAGINKLNIRTDSQFLINCVTKWMNSWKRNGWKLKDGKPVKNRADLEKLNALISDVQIKWAYVAGHKGHHGNEEADRLAVAGSERCEIP